MFINQSSKGGDSTYALVSLFKNETIQVVIEIDMRMKYKCESAPKIIPYRDFKDTVNFISTQTLTGLILNLFSRKYLASSGRYIVVHALPLAVPCSSDSLCSSVPGPRYGSSIGSEFSTGSIIQSEYNPGYLLQGSTAIHCQSVPNALME